MKHTVLMLVAAVLLISLVAAKTNSSASAQRHTGEEETALTGGWEYLVISGGGNVNLSPTDNPSMRKESGGFSREWFPLEKNLDRLGAKGWELVSVFGPVQEPIYYFKRKK
jgi:hypothetical protein